jgi:hypothetical protein
LIVFDLGIVIIKFEAWFYLVLTQLPLFILRLHVMATLDWDVQSTFSHGEVGTNTKD